MLCRGALVILALLTAAVLLLPPLPPGALGPPAGAAVPHVTIGGRVPQVPATSSSNPAPGPASAMGPAAAATEAKLLALARSPQPLGSSISATDPPTITWSNLTVPSLPPAVLAASMAYDPARGMTILFGGLDAANAALNATWGYDSGNGRWTNLSGLGSPPARYAASMAYDALSGDVVLFGGYGPSAPGGTFGDCWVLPQVGPWTPCLPSGSSPSPRGDGTLVSDPAMGGLVLYGGQFGSANLNDTWLWSAGAGWSELHPTGYVPRALWGMEGTPLPGNAGILLFGGVETSGSGDHFYYNTFVLTPSDVFRNLGMMPQPAGMTAGTALGAMAYLPGMQGVVLFGGAYSYSAYLATTYASEQTWLLPWNSTAGTSTGWSQLPVKNVSGEFDIASSYDPSLGAMLIFGGIPTTQAGTSGPLPVRTKFAEFSALTNWTPALNVSAPPPLAFPSVAYDPVNGAIVVFGGAVAIDAAQLTLNETNATWVFSPQGTWMEQHPPHAPPARAGASFTYLPPPLDEFVLFGGFNSQGALGDTWAYHLGGDWTNITGGPSPAGRATQGTVSVPGTDDFYLFGGLTTCAPGLPTVVTSRFLDDTWEFSPSGWTNVTNSVSPGPRAGSFFATGATPGTALLAGGTGPTSPGCTSRVTTLNDTWTFNLTTHVWTELAKPLQDPAVVFGCGAYDPVDHEDLYEFGVDGVFLLSVGYNNSVWRAGANGSFTLAAWSPPGRAGGGEADPAPLPRAMMSCVYDAGRGGTWIYGGIGSTNAGPYTILGDNWLVRDVRWNLSVASGVPVEAGIPFALNASSLDPFGATAPRNATLTLSDLTGTLQPTKVVLTNGLGQVSAEIQTPSLSDRIEACGLGVCVNLSVAVQEVPTKLSLSPLPSTLTAGAPQALTLEVQDAAGAPVTTWNGTAAIGVPGGIVTPSTLTLVDGVARVNVAFLRAGTGFSLWGQAGGLAASEGNFTVLPSFLSQLNLTARPPTTTTGGWVEVDAGGWDAYGNPVSGRSVVLTDGLGDVTRKNGTLQNGSVEFLVQMGDTPGADTLYAVAGNVTASAPLEITPAPHPTNGTVSSTPPSPTPWYLVVLVAAAFAITLALLLAVELRRRERSRRKGKGKGKGAAKAEGGEQDRGKEKVPSGFLAFIPAEEEEEAENEPGPPHASTDEEEQ